MSRDESARRAPRYEVRLSAEVGIEGGVVLGTTRNLSAGGVLIELARPFPEGEILAVRLFVVEDGIESTSAGLALMCAVRWCTDGETEGTHLVGTEFVQMTDLQKKALARAIQILVPAES